MVDSQVKQLLKSEWDTHLLHISETKSSKQAGDLLYRALVWAASLQLKFGEEILAPKQALFEQAKNILPFEFNEKILNQAMEKAWLEGSPQNISERLILLKASNKWKRNLAYTTSGKPRNSFANHVLILKEDEEWKGKLYYDPLLKLPFVTSGSPLGDLVSSDAKKKDTTFLTDAKAVVNNAFEINPLEIDAETYGKVAIWFQQKYDLSLSNEASIYLPLISAAQAKKHNHALEWAKSLQWDGKIRLVATKTKRISTFARCFHDDPKYLVKVVTPFLRIFVLSYVARLFQPGKKVDTILILEGFKGARKSTSMKLLAPNELYFSDSPIDWSAKDGLMMGNGLLIYEVAELERIMRRTNPAKFKAWLRSKVDRYRPPWGRLMQSFPRTFVPYGTVNAEGAWLKDYGKERVFMPIRIEKKINTKKIAAIRDQVIAEAIVLLKKGWAYWPSEQETQLIAKEMVTRMLPNIFTENLEMVLKQYGLTFVRTAEAANLLNSINISDVRSSDTLANAFRQLGWRYGSIDRIGGRAHGWIAPDNWVTNAPSEWPSKEAPIKGLYATQVGLQKRLSMLKGQKEPTEDLPYLNIRTM